jgi:hypothetical protein
MKLFVQFTIIGKQITFDAIDSFVRQVPPEIELVTHAHILKTKTVTDSYISAILKKVNHITLTNVNYGGHSGILPMVFFKYDWYCDLQDDAIFHDGAVSKYLDITGKDKRAGTIGGCSDATRTIIGEVRKNDDDFYPDMALWYNGKAIQQIGSFCPQFTPYGYQVIELQYRMRKAGWNIYLLKDVFDHEIEAHTGRDAIKNTDFVKLHEVNEGLLIQKTLHTGNWWENNTQY